MAIDITAVSLTDLATISSYANVIAEVGAADTPGVPPTTSNMVEARLRWPSPGRATELYVAHDGEGNAVGRAELTIPTLATHKNAAIKLQVKPEHRRNGYGAAIYTLIRDRALALGCSTLTARTSWDMPGLPAYDKGAGRAFAEAAGLCTAELPEVMRRLGLPLRNGGITLSRLISSLGRSAHDYDLVQWIDATPHEYAESVAYLESRLASDAPTGALSQGQETFDAAWLLASESCLAARGQRAVQTGAVHRATGRLVAHTQITADPSQPQHAWQQITIVEPEHRGHRLGFLVKAANIRALTETMPLVAAVDTFNAAENEHMISINDLFGMQPIHGFQHWHQTLDLSDSQA